MNALVQVDGKINKIATNNSGDTQEMNTNTRWTLHIGHTIIHTVAEITSFMYSDIQNEQIH